MLLDLIAGLCCLLEPFFNGPLTAVAGFQVFELDLLGFSVNLDLELVLIIIATAVRRRGFLVREALNGRFPAVRLSIRLGGSRWGVGILGGHAFGRHPNRTGLLDRNRSFLAACFARALKERLHQALRNVWIALNCVLNRHVSSHPPVTL